MSTSEEQQLAGSAAPHDLGPLFGALAKAQGQMKIALKDSANPFFKSKYADLTSVWEACREALSVNGLSVVQFPVNDNELVGIKTILGHSSGTYLESTVYSKPTKAGPQELGSVLTYLRRYALAAAVGVTADDDDGNAGNGRAEGKAPAQAAAIATPAAGKTAPTTATVPTTGSAAKTTGTGAAAAPPKASADPNPKADAHVAAQNMPAPGVKSAGGATSSGKKNDSGAASLKHDGQYITEGQLKVLHITRKEVGGTYCTDEGDARTGWRKVLQVYRDHDGSRIVSSQRLSKAQANHLINRLTDYKLKTQANLARGGEVTPIREPGSDDMVDEEMATTGDLTSLEHAAQERWGDSYKEMFPGWLKAAFDYDSVMELRKQEAIDAAQMIRAAGNEMEATP